MESLWWWSQSEKCLSLHTSGHPGLSPFGVCSRLRLFTSIAISLSGFELRTLRLLPTHFVRQKPPVAQIRIDPDTVGLLSVLSPWTRDSHPHKSSATLSATSALFLKVKLVHLSEEVESICAPSFCVQPNVVCCLNRATRGTWEGLYSVLPP